MLETPSAGAPRSSAPRRVAVAADIEPKISVAGDFLERVFWAYLINSLTLKCLSNFTREANRAVILLKRVALGVPEHVMSDSPMHFT
jgi:hypothetical protein